MAKFIILFFLSFIIFSCTPESKTDTDALDVTSLEVEDVLDELLEGDEIETDDSASTAEDEKAKAETDKNKSEELKEKEKELDEKQKEVITEKIKESPLKGKTCDEILQIFKDVTSGAKKVDYDIMNDPLFTVCKDKTLKEEFIKAGDDDVDEEPW